MMPSSTVSSSRNDQKTHASVGRALLLSARPSLNDDFVECIRISGSLICKLMLFPVWNVDQVKVTSVNFRHRHLSAINSEIQLDCTLVLWIRQPRQSVCQGQRLSLSILDGDVNRCIFWSILWSMGSALRGAFLAIISSGLLTVITQKGRPYRYAW